MHRKDLNGNDIREEPIFNSIETCTNFKYRYQYLTDTFPNPDTVPLDSINPFSCADVDPQKLIWDSNLSFESYSKKRQEPELLLRIYQNHIKDKSLFLLKMHWELILIKTCF